MLAMKCQCSQEKFQGEFWHGTVTARRMIEIDKIHGNPRMGFLSLEKARMVLICVKRLLVTPFQEIPGKL
jgi:hypothetical protein